MTVKSPYTVRGGILCGKACGIYALNYSDSIGAVRGKGDTTISSKRPALWGAPMKS